VRRRITLIEALLFGLSALLLLLAVSLVVFGGHWLILLACLVVMVVVLYSAIRYSIDPDRIRACQSQRLLSLATQTLTYMRQGLTPEAAQEICQMFLSASSAKAVAVMDCEQVLGYVGVKRSSNREDAPDFSTATAEVIKSRKPKVVHSAKTSLPAQSPGFLNDSVLKAAIIVPLVLQDEVAGVLKFYYRSVRRVDETEQVTTAGLGKLLAMQLQLADLEKQRELATTMELKALQAQINPHFLFNTINTIGSLIRTDPDQARILLREFAVFYRRTLDGSLERITMEQEYLQTVRYMGFMIARFGNDRICLTSEIENGLEQILVPAFIIQPLVENAATHGLRCDKPLHIDLKIYTSAGEVLVDVSDDGAGMDEETLKQLFNKSNKGSIALKNVNNRLKGFFSTNAYLQVESELGTGTKARLHLGPLRELRAEEL